MSNTVIQIKRSQTTGTPPGGSLQQAELAYSYQSGKLFIGSANGLDVITIGGKYFLDQSNAAFDVINSAYGVVNSAYTMANMNYTTTNAAYDVINAAYTMANANYVVSNSSFGKLNSAFTVLNAAYTMANANYVVANAAWDMTNSAYTVANAAFDLANTKFDSAGGTISGDVVVTGNLAINGTTTYVDTETLLVKDPLIYLAANNDSSDVVDIGFVGHYFDGSANLHTGLFRSAGDKEFYLFQNYNQEPGQNYIDPNSNNFSLAVLNADIITSNLTLNGANAYVWIQTNFDTTNSAYTLANANFDVTNAAYTMANANYEVSNIAFDTVNAAYTMANANYEVTNSAYTSVNAAYVVVNAAYTSVNAGYTVANAAFNQANTADLHAANASYMNTGTVPEALVTGNYRGITGLGTISIGTWQANTVAVPYGGTGNTTFRTNGVLFGNGTGPLQVSNAGSEGQVLQASASGVPFFGVLDGGGF
jgi:hypothetical protein